MSKENQGTPKTSLAVIKDEAAIIPSPGAMQEALEGLRELGEDIRITDLGSISIGAGGAGVFKVREPGESEAGDSAKTLEGVIIAHHPVNIRWANEFSQRQEGEVPACKSVDGVTGIATESGETIECVTCPYNQFGENGERKACSNKQQLFLLREGDLFPLILSLPPAALKAWRDYTRQCLIRSGVSVHKVVTRIALRNQKNAQKIEYSVPVFEAIARLSNETAEYLHAFGASLARQLQKARVVVEDAPAPASAPAPAKEATQAQAEEAGFIRVADDDLPF